jgi:hypothetical protein
MKEQLTFKRALVELLRRKEVRGKYSEDAAPHAVLTFS